jgi:hypothetical protein
LHLKPGGSHGANEFGWTAVLGLQLRMKFENDARRPSDNAPRVGKDFEFGPLAGNFEKVARSSEDAGY